MLFLAYALAMCGAAGASVPPPARVDDGPPLDRHPVGTGGNRQRSLPAQASTAEPVPEATVPARTLRRRERLRARAEAARKTGGAA